jgi:hypothetical protein
MAPMGFDPFRDLDRPSGCRAGRAVAADVVAPLDLPIEGGTDAYSPARARVP